MEMNENNRESVKTIHQKGHQQPVKERHEWKLLRLAVGFAELNKASLSAFSGALQHNEFHQHFILFQQK